MKKNFKTVIKILFSLVLITFIIFTKINKGEVISRFKILDWKYVCLILAFIFLNFVFSSIRWKKLLVYKEAEKVSLKYLVSLYFTGAFFNNFLPTSVGGDAYKMYKLSKKVGNSAIGISSTFMERFTGVLILILIALLSMFRSLKFNTLILVLWFILGVYIGLFVLRFLSTKIKFMKKIYDAILVYKGKPGIIVYALLTSIVVQVFSILSQYFSFVAVGVSPPVFYSFLAFPVITLASIFIPSINGLGVQDALYISMFSLVGVPPEISFSASIIYHLSRLSMSLVGGVLYALGKDA
jgi:uncharacterized membrane protein YbhN (UPF0104 family)